MKQTASAYLLSILWAILAVSQPAFAQTAEYKLIHMGNQQFHKNNYDKAANYYLQALRKNPNNSRATFNLADCYLAKGDIKGADSLYAHVTQTERNATIRSMAWHNRGYICQSSALQNRDKEQELLRAAIENYKNALRLNPHDNDTRYNLALCQRQLKNSPQQNQQNQQDKQKQEEKKKKENKEQEQQKNQSEQQNDKTKNEERQKTEQYLNLAKQAERRALERLRQVQPRQKSLEKNW